MVRIANKVSSPPVPVALVVTEDGNIPGTVLIAGAAEFPAVSPPWRLCVVTMQARSRYLRLRWYDRQAANNRLGPSAAIVVRAYSRIR